MSDCCCFFAVQARPWFGEDGKLIALPDPLKEVPSRPPIVEDIEPALETEYRKVMIIWTLLAKFGF